MDNNEPDNGPTERNDMSTTRRRRIIGGEAGPQEDPSLKDGDDLKPTETSPRSRTRTLSNQPSSENRSKPQRQQRTRARSLKSTTSADSTAKRPEPSESPTAQKPRVGDTRRPSGNGAELPAMRESEAAKPLRKKRRRGGKGRGKNHAHPQRQQKGERDTTPVEAMIDDTPIALDEHQLERRRGKERKGRPVGRYQMLVHVHEGVTHLAVLEGRSLIEHYVSRPADDVSEIHGNIYLGRVQNVLPGMEAAFVDIGTPKNAVLYRGDVTYDVDDIDGDKSQAPAPKPKKPRPRIGRRKDEPRIEDLLTARQSILCQVTKNPIAHKGARLSTEISLPGRFVVLVPNSDTYGISKRLGDKERRRLRSILDKVKPAEHGVIVRTAAQDVTAEEIERDVRRLLDQWEKVSDLAGRAKGATLLFREPELAVRVVREEFNRDYRGVVIDDPALFQQVKGYMETIAPALADRIEFHDPSKESLSVFERYHVSEQLRKAVDRKVWLPSGGSLVIDHTEALTVIDVNTGKNVGKSNLEETVFRNNLEAAEEIAKQLRLRDIGGIIVIDFIDMEIKKNRDQVVQTFETALARDKTRTQVSGVSDLGLVEMTRRRIGEGLLESVSNTCEHCEGRGLELHQAVLKM
ncbi:MAG: ribonuclease E/G [Acidimicrobiaceae bacterium]|nr:ribonuclease E/G [Acidimicrobiaceae bacterium]